jgi:hypothetical protein
MIPLDSARWGELEDAYGTAAEIPKLLGQLSAHPPRTDFKSEPYFSLWSSLCHQGDVYSASYEAVPHLAAAFLAEPGISQISTLQLLVSIDIARAKGSGPEIPAELRDEYFNALDQSASASISCLGPNPSEEFLRTALAATAVAKGYPLLADALFELEPEALADFLEWLPER